MDAAKGVSATFTTKHWSLKVAKADNGSGKVTSSPPVIDCGATCEASVADGTTVTLTASPAANSAFEQWTGACSGTAPTCTLTISGNTSAVAAFKAKKAPPLPVANQSVIAGPVSGDVLYKKPGSSDFVPLTTGERLPEGTIIDADNGVVNIKAAEGNGKIDSANFWAGTFRIDQYAYRPMVLFNTFTKAKKTLVTQLTLVADLACARASKASAGDDSATQKRRLWGSGKGKFRTKGRYSSATVRGTKWYVEDSCAGTLTKVARGVVEVRDFVKAKTVVVRAGHSYFVKAGKPGSGKSKK
jgi:hypothetical protein